MMLPGRPAGAGPGFRETEQRPLCRPARALSASGEPLRYRGESPLIVKRAFPIAALIVISGIALPGLRADSKPRAPQYFAQRDKAKLVTGVSPQEFQVH